MTSEAAKARATIHGLVRKGHMVPGPCVVCGTTEQVEAHHPQGYEGPNALIVSWVCRSHHRGLHREMNIVNHANGLMTLIEAAAILGVTPHTLRQQVKRGKLAAQKIGRDWHTTPKEVERYGKENRRG